MALKQLLLSHCFSCKNNFLTSTNLACFSYIMDVRTSMDPEAGVDR